MSGNPSLDKKKIAAPGGYRISREKKTITAMVRLFCREQHTHNSLCSDCNILLQYALLRLDRCPYQERKTTCAQCPVHCYQPEMRLKIQQIMRYSGPRMIYRHPVMAARHLIDGRRKIPLESSDHGPETS
jgi:hypothetical protein